MHYNKEIETPKFFESKTVLIIGACGTIGRNLSKQILKFNPSKLRLLDSDDTALTELNDELENEDKNEALRFLYGDIRDKERLIRAFEDINYVFHCAAIKHVAIGEYNPREVVHTNIIGTENVIEAALHNNVNKVIFTSSDKAVNPVSTMGASKLLGEKLIVAANNIRGFRKTTFSVVRFGNVLGSRGSIIPRFKKRVQKGLDLPITDPNMTRFMMPIRDAINLTIKSMVQSIGGEIFVLKMPSLILKDLIDLFLEHTSMNYGKKPKIQIIGSFPGEKNYEELMTEEELVRSIEVEDMYIILPHIKEILEWYDEPTLIQMGKIRTKSYNSHFTATLSKSTLKQLLTEIDLFNT